MNRPQPSARQRPAVLRDQDVEERAATPLELFFDLCFVVAVAFLAEELHHGIADRHAAEALLGYALLFVPIWWAWMSYSWFATAFSHDDTLTRLGTFAQMAGALAVAGCVPSAFAGDLVPFAVAYALMRCPLIALWLRSAAADPAHRAFALTYAGGSSLAQVLWVTGALLGRPGLVAVFAMALAVELATPVAAVRRSPDRTFHPRHVAERYGLFTIIVLGETVLATGVGLREAVDGGRWEAGTVPLVGGGLVSAFALWWLYFQALGPDALVRNRRAAFTWGYGHYLLFAAMAAVGAGLQAQLEPLGSSTGAAVVAGSASVCLATLAWLRRAADPGAAVGPLLVSAAVAALLSAVAVRGASAEAAVLGTAATLAAAASWTGAVAAAQRASSSPRR